MVGLVIGLIRFIWESAYGQVSDHVTTAAAFVFLNGFFTIPNLTTPIIAYVMVLTDTMW